VSDKRLVTRLSLPEAVGMSLSIICPSVTAAFNVTLVSQAMGPAAPLGFAIGTLAMAFVSLSFMAFSHRVAHAGSAYAYIAHTFGKRMGFIAGCALLLTYVTFTTGMAALVGSFLAEALKGFGVAVGRAWLYFGAASILLAFWLARRDMRLAGRVMLLLEAVVVLAIVSLCMRILMQVHPSAADAAATFRPMAAFKGWSGVGLGMVFSILSFAGFEGAAVLGEETHNPRRNIPIALFSTVIGSGLFFVFVSFSEVLGFGMGGIEELAKSQAPLNDLALRFASPRLAIALDLAVAASCFSSVLGPMSAAGRILFALGRGGLSQRMAAVHPVHGTPASALATTTLFVALGYVLWAPFVGAANYYSYTSTIGVLALILVYIGVSLAEMVESRRERRMLWLAACSLGPVLLLWVLYGNLVPVPEYPNNLWPYVTLTWLMLAWVVSRVRPMVTRASMA
jgi:amino acid transporter